MVLAEFTYDSTEPAPRWLIADPRARYGRPRLPETILHAAWRRAGRSALVLKSGEGQAYRVIYPGRPAGGQGPDYVEAVTRTGRAMPLLVMEQAAARDEAETRSQGPAVTFPSATPAPFLDLGTAGDGRAGAATWPAGLSITTGRTRRCPPVPSSGRRNSCSPRPSRFRRNRARVNDRASSTSIA